MLSVVTAVVLGFALQPSHAQDVHVRPLVDYGVYGLDFQYYLKDRVDSREEHPGVQITRWWGRHNKTVDIAIAQPFITKLEIAPGKAFPPDKSFWLSDDVDYVVITGNATFGSNPNSSGLTHGYGDVFWCMAGQRHGPITNIGTSTLVVHAVGMDWRPQFSAVPSWYNPSVDWYVYTNRSYRRVDQEQSGDGWMANPSPHTTECMANGGVWNMNFGSKGNTHPVLRVKWAANCSIPFHYHPTGAMYFILYGNMYFAGDFHQEVAFSPGDSRWVRPGFAYGPEYNGDAPMEITVFGTDTNPMFGEPPNGPYKVQKTIQETHVYAHQPHMIPHNSSQ